MMILKNGLRVIAIVLVPVCVAMLSHLFFTSGTMENWWGLMTIGFLFGVPMGMGALTIFVSNKENVVSRSYSALMPWLTVVVFMIVTLLFETEGWGCWVMAMPLFMCLSSIGGLIARHYKLKDKNKLQVSLVLVLLPFMVAPLEHWIGNIPGRYKADTHIDIHAPAAKIWENVTRVREIPPSQDKGWLTKVLDFPRPVKAELDRTAVGGVREAIFTGGLVFHETVTEYVDQQKMVFTIKANPYEIPSTTMDEHIVIGGEFFDVLNGTYELEQLGKDYYRVHLYSHFKLNTTFNFYASVWAGWIMRDIQDNILQVLKSRCEK
ncbi:hypothetical protein [Chitinophaga sp.]|uniref:hypothetical protein n=1 Tax=Chitinophaga sp. TaxID=1869181 RepID=UPI0031DD32D6